MKLEDIKYIVIHCSATIYNQDITVNDIRKWHTDKGWSDIGYHYVITRDGTLQEGRDLDKSGAHAKGYNSKSWGICLVGGLDLEGKAQANYTHNQYLTLMGILQLLSKRAPQAEILGHRELSPDLNKDGVIQESEWMKECPCFNAKEFYNG